MYVSVSLDKSIIRIQFMASEKILVLVGVGKDEWKSITLLKDMLKRFKF